MPRTNRIAPGGWVFHVLNRGNARAVIFEDEPDYRAFEAVVSETAERFRMRLLAYCLMPNHWHMVLWPREDGDLGRFMQRLTTTHVRRWHRHRESTGHGHLYQGTYKSFPVQQDEHFLRLCRYVERNPLRAGLVERAEAWRWCSLAVRRMTPAQAQQQEAPPLTDWPVDSPRNWLSVVNQVEPDEELQGLRRAIQRGRPFGTLTWEKQAASRLGLQSTLRPRGRPRKEE